MLLSFSQWNKSIRVASFRDGGKEVRQETAYRNQVNNRSLRSFQWRGISSSLSCTTVYKLKDTHKDFIVFSVICHRFAVSYHPTPMTSAKPTCFWHVNSATVERKIFFPLQNAGFSQSRYSVGHTGQMKQWRLTTVSGCEQKPMDL